MTSRSRKYFKVKNAVKWVIKNVRPTPRKVYSDEIDTSVIRPIIVGHNIYTNKPIYGFPICSDGTIIIHKDSLPALITN
jgi:hypothetical protein